MGKTEPQKVSIETSDNNRYATVLRSMITAANACKKLGDQDKLKDILDIADWASDGFRKTLA